MLTHASNSCRMRISLFYARTVVGPSVVVVRTHLGTSPEVLAARLGQAEHGEIRLASRRRHASSCLGSTPELEGHRAG